MQTAQPLPTTGPERPPQAASAHQDTAPCDVSPATAVAAGPVCLPGLGHPERLALEQVADVLGEDALATVGGFRLPAGFRLSVLMPVYNERQTIAEIIRRVRAVPIPKEIVVVDDGSTDGTREILGSLPASDDLRVVLHAHNQGKGAAVRTALAAARGDVVVIQDADLEYDPQEFLALIRPIVENTADVVYGSRYLHGQPRGQKLRHAVANWLLTRLSNLCTGLRLTDMETCHKVFRRAAIAEITIEQNRFGIEPELTAKIARRGCRVVELPIAYDCRDASEGKKIGLKDAFNALWCIARYSFGK